MAKDYPQFLEIERCVCSRLWYTTLVTLNTEIETCHSANYDCDDIEHLKHLIDTNLQIYNDKQQYEWISQKLILGLDDSLETKENLKTIQFHSNLLLINDSIPEDIEKELLELFRAILRAKQEDTDSEKEISLPSSLFLETNLCISPALTCWLFNDLFHVWPILSDLVLQNIHANAIKRIVKKENINNTLGTFLCILSKLNIRESEEDKWLNWLYPRVFDICSFHDVELALYSRKNAKFLKEWHKFVDSKYFRSLPAHDVIHAKKISHLMLFNHNSDFMKPQPSAKEFALRVIKRNVHWLYDILEINTAFLNNGQYDEIGKIMSCPLLRHIWPVTLFYFLDNLPDVRITAEEETWQTSFSLCESLKFLLNKCSHSQYEYQPILVNLTECLNSQVAVIKWILEGRRKCTSVTLDQSLSVKRILDRLQDQSILGVIKKFMDIHECDDNEITSLVNGKDEAVKVFRAYKIMQTALKAVLANEASDETAPHYFALLESSLNALDPLSFRLELVENVFSMLFLRHDAHFHATDNSLEEDGYESSSSGCESREPDTPERHGFVCSVGSVKCLLDHLKRCLAQLGIDFAKLRRELGSDGEFELLHQRIVRMDVILADAAWRLELLTRHESGDADARLLVVDRPSFSYGLAGQALFYNDPSASSDEESRSEELEASSEASSSTDNTSKRGSKKRSKAHASATTTPSNETSVDSKLVVNFMLASKESFVLQCLWKADHARAQQVIEMFDMKGTQLDGQVRFSQAMRHFRDEVTKQVNSSTDTVDSASKRKQELQILENIRQAAQGGYQNSRLTSQLETFLASQESNARLASDSGDAREILALCALDLSLTSTVPECSSSSLLDVAAKRVRSLASQLEGGRHVHHLDDLQRLVQEPKLAKANSSIPGLLCDARVSLKIQEWREKTEFWQRLLEKSKLFQASQTISQIDGLERDDGETLLDDIAELCSNNQEKHLHKIMAHLQILLSMVPNDERGAFTTELSLLSKSLNGYFGHQIFDLNIEPESLDIVAHKLGVNLVHSILVNCCPKLTCYESLRTADSDTWGCVVLNKSFNNNNSGTVVQKPLDPNQCVTNILLELIQAIERFYPDRARISNKNFDKLIHDSEIQQILNKTTLLQFLDLSELSDGEQTTAFFLNLWNLLFLHAQLSVWAMEPPFNALRYLISLSSINYHVGDLGRISLATLRSKLLGGMTWDRQFFSHTEDLNEIAWQDLDLVYDSRVIFAMANEFSETPAIRIYSPQTLNQDLNEGLRDYLNYYCTRESEIENKNSDSHEDTQIVYLPKIVDYENFVKSSIVNSQCSNTTNNESSQNISFVNNYVREHLISGTSDITVINYKPVTKSYDVLLKYEKHNVTRFELSAKRSTDIDCHNVEKWSSRSLKSNILHYLEGHCWLLSYLVKCLHNKGSHTMGNSCDNIKRTACFESISSSSWISTLATVLFDDNPVLAAVSENLSLNDLWIYLEKCLKTDRIQDCLDIIQALPNKFLMKSTEIQYLKDKLLCELINRIEINSDTEKKLLQYIYQIKDVNTLAQMILFNIHKWPVYLCQDALSHALHHVDKDKLPSHCRFKMNETLCRVTVFHKMLPNCENKDLNSTWQDVLNYTEKTDPVCIVQSLVEADKFEICLEWLKYQSFTLEIQSLVMQDLLMGLLKNDNADFKNAHKLLTTLPKRQSMKLCKGVLKRLESIRAMKFVVGYLMENCEAHKTIIYHRRFLGVEILDQLEPKDRFHYAHLIKEPFLMLEQLLMNCKLKILSVILDVIQKSPSLPKSGITMERFDESVRFYAGKALDFRISLQRDGIDSKPKDGSLTASLSSETKTTEFTMPINVPTKEEWIPNDKARECNSCKVVIFSMFNRRHHCRRCGRVVCAACSQQRMQVSGYPKSVLVRVCDDCKQATALQTQTAQGTPSIANSIASSDSWRLTTDETHNKSVREEFSFEHAPNVSMCLSIMSLHSDHKAYASFMLDHCHEMKRLLQPGPGGRINPEIDHTLIIKMIRSLLIAVKMKCAKLGWNAGLAHCDRFLSQVDLIATLVQSDCLALIPTDDSLDEHVLRKLRDLLTEKEQWQLALDVSTKAGLDTQGVWAAWGKAYLKAGHFDRARIKFSHCLEKVLYENLSDWVILTYPESENKGNENLLETFGQPKSEDSPNRGRQAIKSRPIKDPPLVVEILQILENQRQLNPNDSQSAIQSKTAVAQEILTTLNSLKSVSQGQFSLVNNWNSRNVYYEESLHYLLNYASFSSILEFYIKYEEFQKCLDFILENNVDPELFFNSIYIRCLNVGNIEKLLGAMRANDPSLLMYKKYLVYTCHSLEKKQFLHTLYHLQLYMQDFIRAAMACFRFYTQDARDYVDLYSKSHFLVEAQKHLETELNVYNKSVSSSLSTSHGGLTMEMEPSEIDKHINTISRQLEIVKFLNHAEKEGRLVGPYLQRLLALDTESVHCNELPTLFGNQQQKTRLAVLAMLCGRNIEEGFGIAFRIMQDYNLRPQKVYSVAGHVLALEKKVLFIEQLTKCVISSGAPDSKLISDRVLSHCVKLLLHNFEAEIDLEFKDKIDCLIRLISDVELKINSYIESKQLKAAYLLAVKLKKPIAQEKIRKIAKEADRLGQTPVCAICNKWLSNGSS
ncbi:zinc finger FYVE domain-containing protein 26 homolog [Copidosoma floridanum]|uniref:zinc finger FYVE domain-containing protein 26 homolog n=1 Tax=Copidosoma floridanum TaxID=29053 RepID=UPI0006C9B6F6|nr:zinc finger FYVE domain-containing protein 26 homolog [Copidosoma floridanum]